MLDSNDPLVCLAETIEWGVFDDAFASLYAEGGRPAKPIRLMVGLLMLKQLENLSDDNVVLQCKRNPYYQYFCGFHEYIPALPCDASDLVYFRKRLGKEGVEQIFKMSVQLHGKDAEEKRVIIDTTVQEKNITYPTDGKLAIKMVHHLHRIAKREGIQLRRTYIREIKQHRISLRFFRHPKKIKKAKAAIKRLRTIVGILIRDISRNLSETMRAHYQETFDLFEKVRNQQINDKNKIYSLHEQHVYAITKGKDHKKYEYGTKASIVTTEHSGVVIGVSAHEKNEHDSKTLDAALASAQSNRTKPIEEGTVDRGYQGAKEVLGVKICIPGTPKKRDTKYQKEQKRKKFRRRAAIEPCIGHLKSDHRLSRNYLKGFIGDEINLLMAATAWNLKKWINNFLRLLLMLKIVWITTMLLQLDALEQRKHDNIFLLFWRLR